MVGTKHLCYRSCRRACTSVISDAELLEGCVFLWDTSFTYLTFSFIHGSTFFGFAVPSVGAKSG